MHFALNAFKASFTWEAGMKLILLGVTMLTQ